MAFLQNEGSGNADPICIAGVHKTVPMGHAERPHGTEDGSINHETIALAAFMDGKLVWGRQCLEADEPFYLKSIFTYLAGLDDEVRLCRLPGGTELADAFRDGRLTRGAAFQVLSSYFLFLKDQALSIAKGSKLDFYLSLIEPIWEEHDVTIYFVSEGQAAAVYVCEPVTDAASQYEYGDTLWNRLRDQDFLVDSMKIAVFDSGGGTFIALMLQQFEREKRFLDPAGIDNGMFLTAGGGKYSVFLNPQQLQDSFSRAFQAGIDMIKAVIEELVLGQEFFAAVFCGRSYCNRGIGRQVREYLENVFKRAG
ncbi:hypothetical protein F4782DRAFT_534539 [Xylaria castorea]|nr:hypothetical protein F4782DRAFT_534539 [Xylaria castorea]